MTSSLSVRLKAARELVGDLGTRELDRLARLTEGHTSAIETGTRPRVEVRTADALASVLGVSLDWLVRGEGRKPSARSVRASVAAARAALGSSRAA